MIRLLKHLHNYWKFRLSEGEGWVGGSVCRHSGLYLGYFIFLFLFIFIRSNTAHGTNCVARISGNWSNTAIWSCGHTPTCGDSITIPATVTVTVDIMVNLTTGVCAPPNCYANTLIIAGTLLFASGQKMTLCSNSTIAFIGSGQIVPGGGGGSSNLITIGTTVVWNAGSGTINSSTNPTPLPVTWLEVGASSCGGNVCVLWKTATEVNNNMFKIERSTDAINFSEIGSVKSAAFRGNSVIELKYSFKDGDPLSGTSYYRIKQIDFNDNFSYSSLVSLNYDVTNPVAFVVYPNPNPGSFTVDFSGIENNHEVQISIQDELGKVCYLQTFFSNSVHSNKVLISPPQNLEKGKYFCSLIFEELKYTAILIVY